METKPAAVSQTSYRDSVHRMGRIWALGALVMLVLVPTAICVRYNCWPPIMDILKGAVGVVPIFWTVGTIEVFTYVPMLGTGGSYLGFVTGNLSNLKVPCALNAMERANVKQGTDEGEVISTIATFCTALCKDWSRPRCCISRSRCP